MTAPLYPYLLLSLSLGVLVSINPGIFDYWQCHIHASNLASCMFGHWHECHIHASNLASCLFDHLPESAKSEFTAVSIALGLIPLTLIFLGPDTTRVALLSMRRPVLASLLAFGSPAITVGPDPVKILRSIPKVKFGAPFLAARPGYRNWRRWTLVVAISVAEYVIATAAVFNIGYQVWFLTSQAVCWSAIQLLLTTLPPKTAALLFWVLFGVPVKFMCGYAVRWRIQKATHEGGFSGTRSRGVIWNFISWVSNSTSSELTPFMYSNPVHFRGVNEGPAWLFFNQFINLASLAHALMGSIIVSIIFSIGFHDAIIMVTCFLSSAIACRFVVSFELYWMRRNALEIPSESGYEAMPGDKKI
ncbi:hypothetical protein GGR58DRAFT_491912 [Xylaria digitata]|nr:hypothetical protein GGR58DRAFT_491912 [Xylaria digitata]